MTLQELAHRLQQEPENLELHRAVALAYRDHGRVQDAIAVCRRLVELAPQDAASHRLLAALEADAAAPDTEIVQALRPSAGSIIEGATPLPGPMPHHIADPTVPTEAFSREDLDLGRDSEEMLTRPRAALPLRPPRAPTEDSDLFKAQPLDYDDEKTPPPTFMRRTTEDDYTLPRNRALFDHDDDDDNKTDR